MVFSIYFQNSRSIRGKLVDFAQGLLLHDYDIVAICETWLLESIGDSEVCDSRYDVHRRDRPCRGGNGGAPSLGGGVMLLTRRTLGARAVVSLSSDAPYDIVHVVIQARAVRAARDLHVICVYLPGSGAPHDAMVSHLTSYLTENIDNGSVDDYIILGDFNFPNVEWRTDPDRTSFLPFNVTNESQHNFLDTISSLGLDQYNGVINGNDRYLDLFFSTLEMTTSRCALPITREDMPHHPAIELGLTDLSVRGVLRDPKNIVYNFKKANYDVVKSRLASIDWSTKLGHATVDEVVSCFYDELKCIINEEVPKYLSNGSGYPVWFSKPLANIIKEKARYHRRWKKFGNPLDYDTFSMLRLRQKKTQLECWQRYISGCENAIKTNPKLFWSYSNSLRKDHGVPTHISFGSLEACGGFEICGLFLDYFLSVYTNPQPINRCSLNCEPSNFINTINTIDFEPALVQKYLQRLNHNKGAGSDGIPSIFAKRCAVELSSPLSIIFRKSMDEGRFPEVWKEAYVTPVHKSGSRQNVENYRPVSVLACFGKVFELIVHDQLYPVAAAYIPSSQHGFMRRRSTVTNLAVFTDFIARHMDKGLQVDVVYTDYSKCFDRIDHNILISKLLGIGVHGDLLRWLESYLRNRLQAVRIGVFKSNFELIPSGVPQGSHLGPLLFNIYLHDIETCFMNSKILMYADDNKIYMPIRCIADCEDLQTDLNRLLAYCERNRLELNVKKCQTITYTRKRKFMTYNYKFGSSVIPRVSLVRDLGVILDNKLLFTSHFDYITQKAHKLLGFIHRSAKPFRKIESLKVLYFAYVRSITEYASPIWSPSYATHRSRIESVQRCFTRRLSYRLREHQNYEDRLITFRMHSLEDRRLIADLKLLFDIVNAALDCSALVERIGLRAGMVRTRQILNFCSGSARSNYAKHSVLHRIVRLYESKFSDTDPLSLTRNGFIASLMRQLPQFEDIDSHAE